MKITLKQIRRAVFLIALLLLAGWIGFQFGLRKAGFGQDRIRVVLDRSLPADKQELNFNLFWQVWEELENKFLAKEKIDSVEMVYGAISGMVSSLGDPYTTFLTPKENQRAAEDLAGAFGGVGIRLGYIDQVLAVIAPLPDTPAEKAGVKAGDLILKVDDKETSQITLPKAVDLIRGEKGTAVVLTLLHEGEEEPIDIEIVRDVIRVKSVKLEFLDDWCSGGLNCPLVAHLKLIQFGDQTSTEWENQVKKIKNRCQGDCLGVVLDMRNNPGGYFISSVFIASEFLDSGVVVKQENADGSRESYSVDRTGELLEVPLVVLVNKGSASASEIVAGCFQEQDRAKVVGETTFGKGTIQEPAEFTNGAGLHVTTARWLLPSGQSIDGQGLKPDFEVKWDFDPEEKDIQLEKAIEVLEKSN